MRLTPNQLEYDGGMRTSTQDRRTRDVWAKITQLRFNCRRRRCCSLPASSGFGSPRWPRRRACPSPFNPFIGSDRSARWIGLGRPGTGNHRHKIHVQSKPTVRHNTYQLNQPIPKTLRRSVPAPRTRGSLSPERAWWGERPRRGRHLPEDKVPATERASWSRRTHVRKRRLSQRSTCRSWSGKERKRKGIGESRGDVGARIALAAVFGATSEPAFEHGLCLFGCGVCWRWL